MFWEGETFPEPPASWFLVLRPPPRENQKKARFLLRENRAEKSMAALPSPPWMQSLRGLRSSSGQVGPEFLPHRQGVGLIVPLPGLANPSAGCFQRSTLREGFFKRRKQISLKFVLVLEEALQKPLFPSRIEQNRSVRFFFTTSKNGVFLPSK